MAESNTLPDSDHDDAEFVDLDLDSDSECDCLDGPPNLTRRKHYYSVPPGAACSTPSPRPPVPRQPTHSSAAYSTPAPCPPAPRQRTPSSSTGHLKEIRLLQLKIKRKRITIVEKVLEVRASNSLVQHRNREIEQLNDCVKALEAQLYIKDKMLTDTKQQHDKEIKSMQCQLDREPTLQSRFNGYNPGRGKWKKIGLELFNMKVLKDHLIEAAYTHIKENVYTKKSWAYTVDMFHGLNLSGIDNARNIELSCNGHRLIWGSGSVKGIDRQIKKDMHEEINFELIKDQDGESVIDGIKFDMRALFAYLVKAFGLEEEAKIRNVEISITVDGAKLDPNTHHFTIGFKICDKMARAPVSGKFLLSNDEGVSDDQHLDNMQSGSWCCPILAVVAKDNKTTYDKFLRPIFEFGKELHHHGFDDNGEGWLPLNVSEPQDMKSNWLYLQRGGHPRDQASRISFTCVSAEAMAYPYRTC
jgi:hypothetical protein